MRSKLDALTKEYRTSQQSLESGEQKLRALTLKLGTREQTITELRGRIQVLGGQLSSAEQKSSEVESHITLIKKLKTEIERKDQSLKVLKHKSESVEQSNKEYQSQLSQLEVQSVALQNELKTIKIKVKQKTAKEHAEKLAHEQTVAAATHQYQQIQLAMTQMQAQHQAAQAAAQAAAAATAAGLMTPARGGVENKENAPPQQLAPNANIQIIAAKPQPVLDSTAIRSVRSILIAIAAAQCKLIDELYRSADQFGLASVGGAIVSPVLSGASAGAEKSEKFGTAAAATAAAATAAVGAEDGDFNLPSSIGSGAAPPITGISDEELDMSMTAVTQIGLDFSTTELQALMGTATKPPRKSKITASTGFGAGSGANSIGTRSRSSTATSVTSAAGGESGSSGPLTAVVESDALILAADSANRNWHHTFMTSIGAALNSVANGNSDSEHSLSQSFRKLIWRRIRLEVLVAAARSGSRSPMSDGASSHLSSDMISRKELESTVKRYEDLTSQIAAQLKLEHANFNSQVTTLRTQLTSSQRALQSCSCGAAVHAQSQPQSAAASPISAAFGRGGSPIASS